MTERTPGHPDTGQGGHPSADTVPETPAHTAGQPDTDQRTGSGEPKLAATGSWAVLFASFGLSAATWIALAELSGFTGQAHLSGVAGIITLKLAWLMPVAIDGYVVVALVLWTAPVPARVAAFARANTYAAASVGVAAQSAYHSLTTWTATHTVWRAVIAAVVGALPPAVAALAVHMRALVRRESGHRAAGHVVVTATAGQAADTPPVDVPDTAQVFDRVPALTGQAAITADTSDTPDTPTAPIRREADTSNVTQFAGRTRRTGAAADTSIDDLADTLGKAFPDRTVGLPTALTELKRVHGSCSKDRAIAAKNLHAVRLGGHVDSLPQSEESDGDDKERSA